jgi:hypothetical protein
MSEIYDEASILGTPFGNERVRNATPLNYALGLRYTGALGGTAWGA